VAPIEVPYPMSWNDEERDTSCWLGNDMQREAFNKLYSVADRVRICTDRRIKQDWDYLQASNNFRFMTTKHNSVGMNRGIYDSPFDAFTNYMNILGDFISRVNNLYPTDMDNEELNSLLTTIQNQDEEIAAKDREIEKLQKQLEKYNPSKSPELKADKEKKATVKKEPEKKAPVKKAAKKEPEKKAPAKKAAKKAEPEEKPKAKKAKK
jgi:alpha-amylase